MQCKFSYLSMREPIGGDKIAQLSRKIGKVIPSSLAELYSRFNGMLFEPMAEYKGNVANGLVVSKIIPFESTEQNVDDIFSNYEIFCEEFEESDLLPFAYDIVNDNICISLAPSGELNAGAIVLAEEVTEGIKLSLLGETMDEFLGCLVQEE